MEVFVKRLKDPTVKELFNEVMSFRRPKDYFGPYQLDKELHLELNNACVLLGIPIMGIDGSFGDVKFVPDNKSYKLLGTEESKQYLGHIKRIREICDKLEGK